VARTRAGGTRIIFCRDLNDDSLLLRLGVMAAGA
jgi:hypothetical protein